MISDHPAATPDPAERARPARYPGPRIQPATELILEVDGERFAVRGKDADGHDFDYDWLSGPNPGYGFSTSGPVSPTVEQHRKSIRDFLAMIDPDTGYIADD